MSEPLQIQVTCSNEYCGLAPGTRTYTYDETVSYVNWRSFLATEFRLPSTRIPSVWIPGSNRVIWDNSTLHAAAMDALKRKQPLQAELKYSN